MGCIDSDATARLNRMTKLLSKTILKVHQQGTTERTSNLQRCRWRGNHRARTDRKIGKSVRRRRQREACRPVRPTLDDAQLLNAAGKLLQANPRITGARQVI